MVKSLKGITGKPKVNPDVINTGKFFYDGSSKLNVVEVNCDVMSLAPNDCVNNKFCGWCGDKNKCIPGNNRGPLSPCMRSTYLYSKPSGTWNPLRAGTVNINTKGETILTDQPNLQGIHVNKPYN